MKKLIIGIAGHKGVGKDTVARMISYIEAVGITAAKYENYVFNKKSALCRKTNNILHFADNMKDAMSYIFGITRASFDDRYYKDELYYCYKDNNFHFKSEIDKSFPNSKIIDIDDLDENPLSYYLDKDNYCFFTLRTLMQYFGTNVCRDYIAEDIWIRRAIIKAKTIAKCYDIVIIPDVRFYNEAKAIVNVHKLDASLYGVVIAISSDKFGSNDDNHSSENFDINDSIVDKIIVNNSSYMSLFYKILEYIKQLRND